MGDAFLRVGESPLQFPLVHGKLRRVILQRFPFGVFVTGDGAGSTVVAVMHLHRDASSWERRD